MAGFLTPINISHVTGHVCTSVHSESVYSHIRLNRMWLLNGVRYNVWREGERGLHAMVGASREAWFLLSSTVSEARHYLLRALSLTKTSSASMFLDENLNSRITLRYVQCLPQIYKYRKKQPVDTTRLACSCSLVIVSSYHLHCPTYTVW